MGEEVTDAMIVGPPSLLIIIRGRRSRKMNLQRRLLGKWISIQLSRIYWKWKNVSTELTDLTQGGEGQQNLYGGQQD